VTPRLLSFLGPLLVTAGLLVAIECGLRLAGFEAKISAGGDPTANLVPLFHPATRADGTPVWQRSDTPASFLREKPSNGFRVFVLGESPVLGWPFGADFAFPRFLENRLAAAFPDRVVEVVNCGANGVGSWHVRRILEEEVVRHAPDVVIVYTGHGDWLVPPPVEVPRLVQSFARFRIVQLAAAANARWRRWRYGQFDVGRLKALNDPFGYGRQRARGELTLSRAESERIVARFTENLRAMVDSARRAGATVILGTLGQNLRDFPPGASRHRRGLPAVARARWAELVENAERSPDLHSALGALDDALRIDRRPALTYYDRARRLEAAGRFGSARAGYRIASDRDEVPMGARSVSNDVIRAVAAEKGVVLVDVAATLARASHHGLVGEHWFFDHAHPTFAGHVAIARAFAPALGAPGGAWPDPAALETAHPDLVNRAWAGRILVDIMLGWYDVAGREVDEEARRFPDLVSPEKAAGLREGIALLRREDPARPRTDLPEAVD